MAESEKVILELLHNISSQLDVVATKEDVHMLTKRIDDVECDMQTFDIFINGNGKEGARTRLYLIEARLDDIQKKYDAITEDVVNKITIRLLKILGAPIALSIILWVAKIIYDASVHMKLP